MIGAIAQQVRGIAQVDFQLVEGEQRTCGFLIDVEQELVIILPVFGDDF